MALKSKTSNYIIENAIQVEDVMDFSSCHGKNSKIATRLPWSLKKGAILVCISVQGLQAYGGTVYLENVMYFDYQTLASGQCNQWVWGTKQEAEGSQDNKDDPTCMPVEWVILLVD